MAHELKIQRIFQAAKKLISASHSSAAALEPLADRVRFNLSSYISLLNGPDYKELLGRLDLIKSASSDPTLISDDPSLVLYHEICSEAVALLILLDDRLNTLHEADKNPGVIQPVIHPPPPKAILSTSDQKTLFGVLEFIVCLGLYPYLLPGVDAFLKLRISHAELVNKAQNVSRNCRECCLYKLCTVLMKMFNNEVIGPAIVSRHLSDVLAALIQVCYAPVHTPRSKENNVSDCSRSCRKVPITSPGDIAQREQNNRQKSVKERCLVLLGELLNKTFQPLVVKELLILQGIPSGSSQAQGACSSSTGRTSPKWLQRACGQLLSERLMSKNGVHHVISGIMESTAGSCECLWYNCPHCAPLPWHTVVGQTMPQAALWRKCKAVARILASPPSMVPSLEEYYSIVCPQILGVLQEPSRNEESLTIAVETISLMMGQNKEMAEVYLFKPLTHPLTCLFDGQCSVKANTAKEMEVCIATLHKVGTIAEPSSEILSSLLPFSTVFFGLWQSGPKQHILSRYSMEITEWILSAASNTEVMQFLCSLCHIPHEASCEFKHLDQSLLISCKGHPPKLSIERSSEPQELDVMEASAHCVIKLLQTSLRQRLLIGRFFNKCMSRLASILSKDAKLELHSPLDCSKISDPCSQSSSALLECERALPKSSSESLSDARTLYVTAALCENCSEVILQESDLPSLLGACKTIIECHAMSASQHRSAREVRLIPRESTGVEITGGSVTLSICFGLVSAVMSGAKTVDKDYRSILTSMRPSLDVIAADCPDAELCGLAGDMSVCIATLGAVWSAEAVERASDFKTGKKILNKAKTEVQQILIHGDKERSTEEVIDKIKPLPVGLSVEESSDDKHSGFSPFQSALRDLNDTLVPVRGHALIALKKLILLRDEETLSRSSFLLDLFKANLGHSDSYVYLAAISALVALSTTRGSSDCVLRTLCQEYANLAGRPDPNARHQYDRQTGQQVVGRCTHANTSGHSVEVRMKLGEALVKVFSELQDMLPHYLEDIIASLLTTVRDTEPLLRASSLSNIAEICSVGRLTLTPLITEVLSCTTHILKSDREVKVRQAALMVLKHIIKGAQSMPLQDLSAEFLEIYRLLKQVEGTEHDELTRVHAQAALGELDKVMRKFIFPEERKLEKKIKILSST